MQERVLALDVSSKTGFAFVLSGKDGLVLVESGTLAQTHEPPGVYPETYVDWAYANFSMIIDLVERLAPEVLVIEETSAGSKNNYSQKILEFTHMLIARLIKETKIRCVYYMTEEWRRKIGCVMSAEEKKRNKEVRDYKKKNKAKLAKNKAGKVIGKITRKHVNVRRANEIFEGQLAQPLIQKNEDQADALLLAATYHLERTGKI